MTKPANLFIIMTDQQRWDALSCAGNTVLETPNLDRLAAGGAFFKTAISPCPVCGPARSTIFTGCTLETNDVRTNMDADGENTSIMPRQTYDEILVDQGYTAEYYGKWHSPLHRALKYNDAVTPAGVKRWERGPGLQTDYLEYLEKHVPIRELNEGEQYDTYSHRPYRMDPLDTRYSKPPGESGSPIQPDLHGTLDLDSEYTATAYTAREAIKAMERLEDGPFAITCSFHHPHSPILPCEPYASMYPAEEMEAPASIGDPMNNSPYMKTNGRPNHPEYADTEKIKYMISNYYGLVREIDDWVGTLLGKLDELDLAENTLVMFMSDHGEMLGAHGMREKNIFYEESLRVPLMIRFPGRIAAGVEVDEPVSLLDVYATILDYLGVEAGPCDGKTLRRFIEPHERAVEPFGCAEWNWRKDTEPNLMVRTDRWKLFIPNTPTSPVLDALYDLDNDPHEVNNLLGKNPDAPRYAEQAEHLKGLLLSWLEEVNYPYIDGVQARELGKVVVA